MKVACWTVVLICVASVCGQRTFDLNAVFPSYDVRIESANCTSISCSGHTIYTLFRRGSSRPFQRFILPNSFLSLSPSGEPEWATVDEKSKGKWSSLYFADFNFDGKVDLAFADGDMGGYRSTSYRIYVYNPARRRFIYEPRLTKLAHGPFIGIPKIERRSKTLSVFWKSGCCFHEEQKYRIRKNRPIKIYQRSEDIWGKSLYITTRKRINGRWRSWTRTTKAPDQN